MKRMMIAAAIVGLSACGPRSDSSSDTLGGMASPMDTTTAPAAAPAPTDTGMARDTGMMGDTSAMRDTGAARDTSAGAARTPPSP